MNSGPLSPSKPWMGRGRVFSILCIAATTPGFSSSPDGSLGIPAAGDIHTIDGIDKHARHRGATMSDSIRFQISRNRFIPLTGFHGNVMVKDAAGFSSDESRFLESGAHRLQESINGSRRNGQQGFLDTLDNV